MLFILALCVAVVCGALANNFVRGEQGVVRFAATVGGAILGFFATYYVAGQV